MASFKWPAIAVLLFALIAFAGLTAARDEPRRPDAVVAASDLPREARDTIQLIRRGGPFRYDRDGIEFRNFERALPARERGYYREYTVPTPGLTHRGARRIVAGRNGELYYTDDHYRTFRRIRE